MNRFCLSILFSCLWFFGLSESNVHLFEGNINLVRETVFDTTYINVYVKGKMVRVDEFDKRNSRISTHIVDLEKGSVLAINSDSRQYMELPISPPAQSSESHLEIIRTGNYKEINGYTCYQLRVRDTRRNTEVAYWVADERFAFFERLLILLNRTEVSLHLFQFIPGNDNFFPMLTEERTLLRKKRLQIAVVGINESNISPSLFQIPSGYSSVRNNLSYH